MPLVLILCPIAKKGNRGKCPRAEDILGMDKTVS
jgi:hypothetical protein